MANFEPIDGSNNCYSQLYCTITKSPFEAAAIKGFTPAKVFKASTNYVAVQEEFQWSTCQELDKDLNPFPWFRGKRERIESTEDQNTATVMYTSQPAKAATTCRSFYVS